MQLSTDCSRRLVRYPILIAALCIAVAFVVVAPAHASNLSVYAGVSALQPGFLNAFDAQSDAIGPVTATLHKQEYFLGVFQDFAYDGFGVASANYTALGASSRLRLTDYTPLRFGGSQLFQSGAQFDDDITVAGSGPGFFEMTFNLSGSAARSDPGPVGGGVFFNANINFIGGVTLNSFPSGALPQGVVTTGLIPITLGVPFHVVAQLVTSIVTLESSPAFNGGSFTAQIDYLNTAAITGVQAYDAQRNPLPSFTTDSVSGTNYAAISSVPLPGGVWLLALSIVTLFRRGWDRRAWNAVVPRTQIIACDR